MVTDPRDITVSVSKSEPNGLGEFIVTFSGFYCGESFTWTLPDPYTAETWTPLIEKFRSDEFRRIITTQF